MHISNKRMEEFKEIYRTKLGKDLSNQEALEKATKLLVFFTSVCKILANDDTPVEIESDLTSSLE